MESLGNLHRAVSINCFCLRDLYLAYMDLVYFDGEENEVVFP